MRLKILISILLIIICNSCLADLYEEAIIEDSPSQSTKREKNQFLSLVIENDSLLSNKDEGYTSGVLLSYFDSSAKPIRLARFLNNNLPFVVFNEDSKVSYSLGQNIYTPKNITVVSEQRNDRPWAGFLYGTLRSMTATKKYIDDVELTLGVVGPAALAGEAQKFAHSISGADKPRGWKHQLKNEPGFVVTWGRRMLSVLTTEIKPLTLVFEPNFIINLGNVYTTAEVGGIIRLMPISSSWVDTPLLVRPAMPGSSFFYSNNKSFSWYGFIGAQGRGVLRNIFLDGNTFQDSPSIKKKPFVLDINSGIALMYSNIRLSFTVVYRTKEFYKQDSNAIYNNLNISYSF